MKVNQFRGGLFEFHSNLGGLMVSLKKSQNGGSVHIFHQIWSNYRVNLLIFCYFGGGAENFPLKNFSRDGDLGGGGGGTLGYCFLGGSRWDWPRSAFGFVFERFKTLISNLPYKYEWI